MKSIKIDNFEVGGKDPLLLMAGPCVLEDEDRTLMIGKEIKRIAQKLGMPYVFKASFNFKMKLLYVNFSSRAFIRLKEKTSHSSFRHQGFNTLYVKTWEFYRVK